MMSGLDVVPEIRELFHRHHCEYMAIPSGKYSSMMVQEFYASYVATVKKQTPAKAKELDQLHLLTTLVWEIPIDLSKETVRRVLYGPTFQQTVATDEFDHRMQTVWDEI